MMKKYYGEKSKVASPGASKELYSKAHAGMPEDKILRDYPKSSYGLEGYGDDLQHLDMLAQKAHKKLK